MLSAESLRMLVPTSVAVPDTCETDWCSKPRSPMALMQPATKAKTKAPYSIHLGSLDITDLLLAVSVLNNS
mgnify:CR=1 FL=1